jgi:2-polyprenyl-6-methoxyphenol hydroxylase-like FAD-dependent oxidoreductase
MTMESIQARNNVNGTGAPALTDVAIVGGGFAGCLAAIVLGRAGHKVTLIDINPASPALFRAEKISGDQLLLLQEFGLLDDFKAASTPVVKFINIRGKRIVDHPDVEEYCLLYPAMVELLRKRIPPNVLFKRGRVLDIDPSDCVQRVVLASGETINARLVVLATGQGEVLRRKLGFERRQMHPQQTLCVGFSIRPPDSGFHFPALAAYGERCGDGVDYLSLFPLGDGMRANLFLFSDVRDPRVGALRDEGMPALFDLLPGLRFWIDDCEWVGDVATFPVELSKCENVVRNGVVLIGDAHRTTCPAVGTGLSCVLVDVLRLRDHVASWLKTPGMEATKIASFYSDPVKTARDDSAFQLAFLRRSAIMQSSLAHQVRLAAHFAKRGLRDRLRRLAKAA